LRTASLLANPASCSRKERLLDDCRQQRRHAVSTLREAPIWTIADHMLQGESGTDVLRAMKEINQEVPAKLFSGKSSEALMNVDDLHQ
jgi:DNA-binding response OmpR family regulator